MSIVFLTPFTRVADARCSCSLQWLSGSCNELDELVQKSLKRSHVMTQGHYQHAWQWDLIMAVLRWPSEQLQRINNATYRLFVKRLVHFYKPSAELFIKTSVDHRNSRKEAETLMLLAHFLLQVPDSDTGRHLEELLMDIVQHLKPIASSRSVHDNLFSGSSVSTTCSHYYFLLLGVLSRSSKGHHLLTQSGVFELLHEVVKETAANDIYIKLIVSSLDYTIDGLNRTVLELVLRQESCVTGRVYATGLLRALIRCQSCPHTLRWIMQQLVKQLYDDSAQVRPMYYMQPYNITSVSSYYILS